MELKEKIKSKVDQLDLEDLKLVDELLDSLNKKQETKKSSYPDKPPFYDVIRLLGPKGLTTADIIRNRNE